MDTLLTDGEIWEIRKPLNSPKNKGILGFKEIFRVVAKAQDAKTKKMMIGKIERKFAIANVGMLNSIWWQQFKKECLNQ